MTCEHRRFTDLHHIVPWAQGGETSYANLIRLCRRHHRLLHEGGYTVEARSAERFVFHRPVTCSLGVVIVVRGAERSVGISRGRAFRGTYP